MKTMPIFEGGEIEIDLPTVKTVRLIEMLGSGAFGAVWRVQDPDTNQLYVLKIIQGIKPGSIEVDRVRLEAEVKINSIHIIPVIGLKQFDTTTFLILFEYVSGQSLDLLLAAGTLNQEQKREIFYQILLGVSAAHLSNIIHRDLKPANILITDKGQVKIIDFGISKFKDREITMSATIMGTLAWMPPEVLRDGAKTADTRTDIYALGHILYELATGKHFWEQQNWTGLEDFGAYLSQIPQPEECIDMRGFKSDLFPNIAKIIKRMVKANLEARYPNIDHLIEELAYRPKPTATKPDFVLGYPVLRVESGSNQGAMTVLDILPESNFNIGRLDLAGNDTSISRQHLEFRRRGNRYYLRDLDSKNGTWLRGLHLTPDQTLREIQHGDSIKVGDIFLKFLKTI